MAILKKQYYSCEYVGICICTCLHFSMHKDVTKNNFPLANTVQIQWKLFNTAGYLNEAILHGRLDSFSIGSCQRPINVQFIAVYFLRTKNWDIFVTLKHSSFLTLIQFASTVTSGVKHYGRIYEQFLRFIFKEY